MERTLYLKMAEARMAFPIGMDLMLHQEPDPATVLASGAALGGVLAKAARRFGSPLAIPLMDLQLEKAALLHGLGYEPAGAATAHFQAPPTEVQMEAMHAGLQGPLPERLQVQVDAIRYIVERETDLLPCAMTIGPFSLLTKLLKDPIEPVYLAGMGVAAEEDDSVACVERCLVLAMMVIERSLRAQLEAGAKMAFIAEPAANKVYLSPKQMDKGSDVFERLVMVNLRRYKAVLDEYGVDLWFHDCGDLTDAMIAGFASLDPAVLSLGSSRPLWEIAPLVSKNTVLYGNLPSKMFYSDAAISTEQVRTDAAEIARRLRALGHPFILGTECDVLHVPGAEATIWSKVEALMSSGGPVSEHAAALGAALP